MPPGFEGSVPDGYFVIRSPTYSVAYLVRGFQSEGKTDQAVSLIKQTKIYPLFSAASPAQMEFLDGSRQDINTVFPDNFHFFELLAQLVDEEPLDVFGPLERFQMQAIGIRPDDKMKALLSEAARVAEPWHAPTPMPHPQPAPIILIASGRASQTG